MKTKYSMKLINSSFHQIIPDPDAMSGGQADNQIIKINIMKTKVLTIITSVILLLAFEATTAQKSKLYGSWQATNGSIMSFTKTTMTVAGSPYRYTVRGNIITVYDENNNTMQYKYKVEGNQLYLYAEGYGTYVLTKTTGQAQNTGYGNNGYGNQTGGYGNAGQGNAGQGNTAANAHLYGTFCSYSSSGYSGSSSYSTTERVSFDGRGHYTYGSQSSYSGGGDGYYGGDGGYTGTYRVVGNQGVILTASDGSQYRVAIYYVKQSGEITELKYDGTLYAKSLCD